MLPASHGVSLSMHMTEALLCLLSLQLLPGDNTLQVV